jgi:deoxyribonuclease IV
MQSQNSLRIGTAGVPASSPKRSSAAGIQRVREIGLDAMELEFVRGSIPGHKTAEVIRRAAEQLNITLTAHAPYYINLNSRSEETRMKSRDRLADSVRAANRCGALSVAVHLGWYHDDTPDRALATAADELEKVLEQIGDERGAVTINPETSGRHATIGTIDEIIRLSEQIEAVEPCIDWAHLYVREQWEDTATEARRVLDAMKERLGADSLDRLHMHISGITANAGGERKHVRLDEEGPDWRALLDVLREYRAGSVLICESPDTEADAITLNSWYRTH